MKNEELINARESDENKTDEPWKARAEKCLTLWYHQLRRQEWLYFNLNDHSLLLVVTILFAINGPPIDKDSRYEFDDLAAVVNKYDKRKRSQANRIKKQLFYYHKKSSRSEEKLGVSVIFIYCKDGDKKIVPIFRLNMGIDPVTKKKMSYYIDLNARKYWCWKRWMKDNPMDSTEYCYMVNGFETCSEDGTFVYDPKKRPTFAYAHTPAYSFRCQTATKLDCINIVASGTVAAVSVGGSFLVFPSVIAVVLFIATAVTMGYTTPRKIYRLYDKYKHGECLYDMESLYCYASILLFPLALAVPVISGKIAAYVPKKGLRLISAIPKVVVAGINYGHSGIKSLSIVTGFATFVEKVRNERIAFIKRIITFVKTMVTKKPIINDSSQEKEILVDFSTEYATKKNGSFIVYLGNKIKTITMLFQRHKNPT